MFVYFICVAYILHRAWILVLKKTQITEKKENIYQQHHIKDIYRQIHKLFTGMV